MSYGNETSTSVIRTRLSGLRALRQRLRKRRRRGRSATAGFWRPMVELLEDRRVLASIMLTTTTDVVDGVLTDLPTLQANPGPDGFISLREAVIAANNSGGVPDTINLPAGNHALTISGALENLAATGDLDVSDTLELVGVNQGTNPVTDTMITGVFGDRVFQVMGSSLTFRNLTIQGGTANDDGSSISESHGGGVLSHASTLVLDNVLLQNSGANGFTPIGPPPTGASGAPAKGGGIYATESSQVSISNGSLLRSLQVTGGQGDTGVSGSGAGIGNGGSGGAGLGGGIYIDGGSLAIVESTVQTSSAFGGLGGAGSATANPLNPIKAGGLGGIAQGGGVYALDTAVSIENSTIYFNRAQAGTGGSGGVDSDGGVGGDAEGGGVYARGGSFSLTYDGAFPSDGSVGKVGLNNATSGTGGVGAAANEIHSVAARDGGAAGTARGGGVYVDVATGGTTPTISDSSANPNPTLGANGATGSMGGFGGFGNSLFVDAANGGRGGDAQGGGIFLANAFSTDFILSGATVTGNVATAGNGGGGGTGGVRQVSNSTSGLGGAGGPAGVATGGGMFATSGTNTMATGVQFSGNEAFGGGGGEGGSGGNGFSTTGADAGNGGHGGDGSTGGEALGAGLYVDDAIATFTNSIFSDFNRAVGGDGGGGGIGGVGGTTDAGFTPGSGGDGGDASSAGQARGGGIFAHTGATVTLDGSAVQQNRAKGGLGGTGGTAAAGGAAATAPTPSVAALIPRQASASTW